MISTTDHSLGPHSTIFSLFKLYTRCCVFCFPPSLILYVYREGLDNLQTHDNLHTHDNPSYEWKESKPCWRGGAGRGVKGRAGNCQLVEDVTGGSIDSVRFCSVSPTPLSPYSTLLAPLRPLPCIELSSHQIYRPKQDYLPLFRFQ